MGFSFEREKSMTITNAFQNILQLETLAMQDKSRGKPNKAKNVTIDQ